MELVTCHLTVTSQRISLHNITNSHCLLTSDHNYFEFYTNKTSFLTMHRTQKGIPDCYSSQHTRGRMKGTFHYIMSLALALVYSIYNFFWTFWLCDSPKHCLGVKLVSYWTSCSICNRPFPSQSTKCGSIGVPLDGLLAQTPAFFHYSWGYYFWPVKIVPLHWCVWLPLSSSLQSLRDEKIVEGLWPWPPKKNIPNYSVHSFKHFIWVQGLLLSFLNKQT
jgi:hypothetical protein